MPELPEVETIRRSLEPLIKGKKILKAKLNYPNLLKNALVEEFENELMGQIFSSINRRGKYLMFNFESDLKMIIHLRMTGQLRYEEKDKELIKHTHIIFDLDDNHQLRYVDVRKFGMINIGSFNEVVNQSGWHKLGPEPLSKDLTFDDFFAILQESPTKRIKALLLDQHKIAGIGNIYADEMLFRSKIHPLSLSGSIPKDIARLLYEQMRKVLKLGIENRGTTLNDYVDGFGNTGSFQFSLKAYGRENELCEYCLREISKIKVAGRSSHICNNCQIKYE